ncbi:MAG: TonB-dependent receptor [Pseudomonadota bacterium]
MLGGIALACLAGRADAADSRLRLSIPVRSYADALIDLGLQANISILGTSTCGAGGRVQLSGSYTLEQALDRILNDAPCRYRIVDARTVRIIPMLPREPAAAPREPVRTQTVISELVVTATKRPAALGRLPAGVSVLSRGRIDSTRAVDPGLTTGQLAGVLTTNLGPGRDKLLIRGLSDGAFTGRTRSTVSTYLDDTPINYNAPDPDLRFVDVDRIEVVRGPQGALYGSGAIAGIFRIVTAKPDPERFAAGASATVATTRGGDASHELDGYVNIPLVKDRAAIRIAAYEDVQGGYLDDVNLRLANVDQTRRDGGRVALNLKLSDDWRFEATAATQHLRSNDTQYVTPDNVNGMRSNRVREAHNNDFSFVSAKIAGDFEWGSVSSTLSYVHHVFSSQYDASAVFQVTGAFPTREADLGAFVEATRSNMLVQDLVVRSAGASRLSWLVGLYAARTLEHSPSELTIPQAGRQATLYTERRKDVLTELALYGEAGYALGGGWTASLGGRVFQSRVRTTADLEISAPYSPRNFARSETFDGFSPKISLQRELANGDLIYGLITEGYRPGGFNSSGFFAINTARETFRPDRLRNYEVGAKIRRLDNRLTLRATAYYDDWSNIQSDRYRQSGLSYTANVSDARILGLEAELGYEWSWGFGIQLNGLLASSRTRNVNPAFNAPITKDLPGVPQTSGGVLAVYQRDLPDDLSLRLVGEAAYIGRSDLSFDQSLPREMGHFVRVRLSAEVARDAWRLAAFVNNPFDDESDTFAYGNPFTFDRVRQVTPQRPRTVGLRLAADF